MDARMAAAMATLRKSDNANPPIPLVKTLSSAPSGYKLSALPAVSVVTEPNI